MKTSAARFPLPAVAFVFAGFTFPRFAAVLPKGSLSKRLEKAKAPSFCGPYYSAPKPAGRGHGISFYLDSDFAPGLRWEWCDQVEGVRIRHTGWFTDEHGDTDTIRGLVMRLPKGRGFLAGWSMGSGMASAVDCEIYADASDAAYAADCLAERAAERERDYQESFSDEVDAA